MNAQDEGDGAFCFGHGAHRDLSWVFLNFSWGFSLPVMGWGVSEGFGLTQTFEVLSLTSSEIMLEYSTAIHLVFCCLVFAPPTVEECAFNPIITGLGESRFAFRQRLVNDSACGCLQVVGVSISCQRTIQLQKNCSHYT